MRYEMICNEKLIELRYYFLTTRYNLTGWPEHLYIPKGNHEGLAFDLFVMVTNFDDDFVADDPRDLELPETCTSPYIFCGVPRRRYPDAKPMGYPFDRPGYHVSSNDCGLLCKFLPSKSRPVSTLEEYVAPVPNMAMIPVNLLSIYTMSILQNLTYHH